MCQPPIPGFRLGSGTWRAYVRTGNCGKGSRRRKEPRPKCEGGREGRTSVSTEGPDVGRCDYRRPLVLRTKGLSSVGQDSTLRRVPPSPLRCATVRPPQFVPGGYLQPLDSDFPTFDYGFSFRSVVVHREGEEGGVTTVTRTLSVSGTGGGGVDLVRSRR